MPHDKNGTRLEVGDEVILRCRITEISEGVETACNVTAEAIERPDGEGYIPTIAGNSRFYEKPKGRDKLLNRGHLYALDKVQEGLDKLRQEILSES